MRPLLPAAAVLFFALPSLAADAGLPGVSELIEKAQAVVGRDCRAKKPSCAAAKSLLEGAGALAKDAAACVDAACTPAAAARLEVRHDQLQSRLFESFGAKSYGADALSTLFALLSRVEKDLQEARPRDDEAVRRLAASDCVDDVCKRASRRCAEARLLLADMTGFSDRTAQCAKTGCDLKSATGIQLTAERDKLMKRYFDVEKDAKPAGVDLMPLFLLVDKARDRVDKVFKQALDPELGAIGSELDRLEARTSAVEQRAAGAGAKDRASLRRQLEDLGAGGGKILERFATASEAIDVSAQDPEDEAALKKRKSANDLAVRIAALRDRLQELARRLDLAPADDQAKAEALDHASNIGAGVKLGAGAAGLAAGPASAPEAVTPAKPMPAPTPTPGGHRTLLDAPRVPIFSPFPSGPPAVPAPPIDPSGGDNVFQLPSRLAGSKGELAQIDAMRRLGQTRTVGDPGGRAKLVHAQTGGTCSIVSQQQILEAYGVIARGDAAKTEDQLKTEAANKGFFDNGVPPRYEADLLVEHGMVVTKRYKAADDDLAQAVKKGGIVLVGVDAARIWDIKSRTVLGHALIVTGAELDKSGKVLGYYFNDSGADPPKGGRFLPAGQFLAAWRANGAAFYEVK